MCSVLNHCAIQYIAHERFSWPENYSVCRPSCAGWCVAFFLSQAVTRVGRMFSVAVCLGFRVPFSFTLISVILLVDLRGIFIVRACHHLWGYTLEFRMKVSTRLFILTLFFHPTLSFDTKKNKACRLEFEQEIHQVWGRSQSWSAILFEVLVRLKEIVHTVAEIFLRTAKCYIYLLPNIKKKHIFGFFFFVLTRGYFLCYK